MRLSVNGVKVSLQQGFTAQHILYIVALPTMSLLRLELLSVLLHISTEQAKQNHYPRFTSSGLTRRLTRMAVKSFTMNAPRALSFLFLYEFSLLVCAESNHTAATTSDEKQVMVGWTAGPTQRGTLMLVYGCLSTIFVSTWTVLHLNVPHPDDGVGTRTLRKMKWMAITILFPEFIFSKAVCELRLAVADLYAMHVELEKARVVWSTTMELDGGKVPRPWIWKAEFGPWMRRLYKLLRLPHLKVSKQEQDKIQNSSSAEIHGSVQCSQ